MRATNETRDGDAIPRAHCARHVHVWLTFERTESVFGGWECYCADCVDYDFDTDGASIQLFSRGCGDTPSAALEDYAELEGADPRELDCSGEESHV